MQYDACTTITKGYLKLDEWEVLSLDFENKKYLNESCALLSIELYDCEFRLIGTLNIVWKQNNYVLVIIHYIL